MTKSILALIAASLPLLGGCTGDPNGDDTGPVNGDDTSTGDDTATAIEAPFSVELPAGMTGAVTIWIGDEGNAEEQVGSCDVGATTCTYTAGEAGTYWVTVEAELAIFLAKTVEADADGAFPDTVSWETGGCGDTSWTPESHTACASWTPGEWGLAPSGTYIREDGREYEIVSDNSPDVTGDGIADIVIEIAMAEGPLTWAPVVTVAGAGFYGAEGESIFTGSIASDLETVIVTATIDSTSTFDHTLERQ